MKPRTICWTIFVMCMVIFYLVRILRIKLIFEKSQKLYTKAQKIIKFLKDHKPEEIEIDHINTLILSANGNTVYLDSTKNIINNKGQDSDEDQIELFDKMGNEKNKTTMHVINDYIHVITASQIKDDNYCVIVYI